MMSFDIMRNQQKLDEQVPLVESIFLICASATTNACMADS